jgi:formamidopyrimidine-DNA glycosylase
MPELPEVETTVRSIAPYLVGKVIVDVAVLRPNMVGDPGALRNALQGKQVVQIRRRGKYILAELQGGDTMIIHLKMSGRLAIRKTHETPLQYERILLQMQDKTVIVFNDPRTLGRMTVMPTAHAWAHPSIQALGPDALDIDFDAFRQRLTARPKRQVKELLMDQGFVAGVGNIYAQEACFYALVDPRRTVKSLTKHEQKAVYQGMRTALLTGLQNMGTSISDFSDLFGKPGQTIDDLWVYGRGGERCRKCKTALRSCVQKQRTTAWCPKCQQ